MSEKKPPRTLGIMLAIVASVLMYSIFPLVFVSWTLFYRLRLAEVGVMVGMSSDSVNALGVAVLTWWEVAVWLVLALGYAGVAVLSWRGVAPMMRHVMTGSVVLVLVGYTALGLYRLQQNQQALDAAGGLSAANFLAPILNGGFGFSVLVTLYVVWYLNRAPSRAFFRGHYLTRDDETGDSL